MQKCLAFAVPWSGPIFRSTTPEYAMPRVFVSLRVHVQRILPLTDGHTRAVLRVSHRRLTEEHWQDEQDCGREALTQAIGRIARDLGFEGLLVPAAQGAGQNLVVFPDRLLPGSRLETINAVGLRSR